MGRAHTGRRPSREIKAHHGGQAHGQQVLDRGGQHCRQQHTKRARACGSQRQAGQPLVQSGAGLDEQHAMLARHLHAQGSRH